jgi:hypothetical protein
LLGFKSPGPDATISLAVIVGILAVSIGLSFVFPASRTPKDLLISRPDR